MAYSSRITEEQIHRGLLAEYRFFLWMNTFIGDPWWFYGASQGNALMDVRNVDGFVWTRKRKDGGLYRRIPVQIKSATADMVDEISSNGPVYILNHSQSRPEIVKRNAFERLEKALDLHFETYINKLLSEPPTRNESEKMTAIEHSRVKAHRLYLIATNANESESYLRGQ